MLYQVVGPSFSWNSKLEFFLKKNQSLIYKTPKIGNRDFDNNRMWPKLGKMLVSMANISSHKNQTFESFPKLSCRKRTFPQIERGGVTGCCQKFFSKIWAQQQGGLHLEVKREHWLAVEIVLMIKILNYNLESRS